MAIVYVNEHPDYEYATVVLSGYCDLRQYVRERNYLTWEPTGKTGRRQIMISGKDRFPERIEDFITYVKALGCEVKKRNDRGDEWEDI